jgi:hypothetical protein
MSAQGRSIGLEPPGHDPDPFGPLATVEQLTDPPAYFAYLCLDAQGGDQLNVGPLGELDRMRILLAEVRQTGGESSTELKRRILCFRSSGIRRMIEIDGAAESEESGLDQIGRDTRSIGESEDVNSGARDIETRSGAEDLRGPVEQSRDVTQI